MANDNGKKKGGQESSAEDILGQLAQKMGVDDEEATSDDEAAASEEESDDAANLGEDTDDSAADDGAPAEDEADEVTPQPAPAPTPVKAGKGASKSKGKGKSKAEPASLAPPGPVDAADSDAEEEPEYSDWVPLTNDEAISTLFSGDGAERPIRPIKDTDDAETVGASKSIGWILFAVLLAVGGAALGGAYATLSDDQKECFRLNMRDRSACDDYFKAIEAERIAQQNRERLAAAPKYGTLTITTDPRAMRVVAQGQDTLVFPGTRNDIMVPVRSQISFENISVSEPFQFTIMGEGVYEDKVVTVPAFSDPTSPWIQNQVSGDYHANLTYSTCWPGASDAGAPHCLTPNADTARELRWRMSWRPAPDAPPEVPSRLMGTITVTSDPPGAAIIFNNQQLYNEETGEPYVTPHTFSTYNAPRDREDRTPLEVYLSREGLRVTVGMEGKVNTADGVYLHHFQCNPVPGRAAPAPDAENPDFLGYCNYTYQVHLPLRDPPPPPAEGSGAAAEAPAGNGSP